MAYEPIRWEDAPSEATPIDAENLNHMDNQIKANENNIEKLNKTTEELKQKANELKIKTSTGTDFKLTTSEGGVLIKSMIGASSQDGTPTPDNPIEIKSADVNITSRTANLIPFPYYENSVTRGGITFTTLADGSVVASGTASTNTYIRIVNNTQPLFIEKGKTYRLSEGIVSNDIRIGLLYRKGNSAVGTDVNDGENGTIFTVPTDLDFDGILINCWIRGGTTVNNVIYKPMITEVAKDGTYPTEYAPPFSTTADTSITLRAIGDVKDELQFVNDKFQIVRRIEHYETNSATTCQYYQANRATTDGNKVNQMNLPRLENTKMVAKEYRSKCDGFVSNYFKTATSTSASIPTTNVIYIGSNGDYLCPMYDASLEDAPQSQTEATNWFKTHNLEIDYILETPYIEEITNEDAIKLLGLKSWEDTTYLIQNNECNGAITLMYGTTPEISKNMQSSNQSIANKLSNPVSMISEEWLSAKTYAQGEFCIKDNTLWKSKVSNNIGNVPSESSYWTATSICNELIALWNK